MFTGNSCFPSSLISLPFVLPINISLPFIPFVFESLNLSMAIYLTTCLKLVIGVW